MLKTSGYVKKWSPKKKRKEWTEREGLIIVFSKHRGPFYTLHTQPSPLNGVWVS